MAEISMGCLYKKNLDTLSDLSFALFSHQNGFAVVRPPGHHAEESTAMSVQLLPH